MEENQEQKQSRSSQGNGQLTFETKNGEKVEIQKVEHIKEMKWHQWGDGPKDYEYWHVLPKTGYECFDVTVTKDGESTTKRCYLQMGYNDFKIENAMDDEELAQAVEEFFAPERLEEREQEAKEHNSTYLYMGGIDREKNGEWYRFRTHPDNVKSVYKDIRSDEKKEVDFIASHVDPKASVASNLSYSQEEIKEAQTRLDEIIEMDLIDNVEQMKAQLEEAQSELAKHRQKMSMRKSEEMEFSITPKEASNIAEIISNAEGQIRDDMSRKEPENGLVEQAEEFEQQVRNDLHNNPR